MNKKILKPPPDAFNEWWDSDRHDGGNPFQTDSFAYWAWKGWQAALAQRPWVGLTDGDWSNIQDRRNTSLDTFQQGVVWAADILRGRNK